MFLADLAVTMIFDLSIVVADGLYLTYNLIVSHYFKVKLFWLIETSSHSDLNSH